MSLGKGLAFSALGAVVGALVWVVLIQLTGWGLWLLAPIVGGAAGFGMMRGTQMKGGVPAGIMAAVFAFIAIFASRIFVVNSAVSELLAVSEDDAVEAIAADVAAELEEREIQAYDDEGNFTDGVYTRAHKRWSEMPSDERDAYLAGMQQEHDSAQNVLTPLALVFDFGLFGTICTVLSIGTAFKTASTTLEEALIEKGHAMTDADAQAMASSMRAVDLGRAPMPSTMSRWTTPLPPPDESDLPPLQSQGDEASMSRDDGSAESGERREAA